MVEHIEMDSRSPRSSHDTLLVAPSPRHRSRSGSRHYSEVSETDMVRTISPRRSISRHSDRRRLSSPMRVISREDDFIESDRVRTGPLALVARPRYEDVNPGYDLIRDTEITDNRGNSEEIMSVRRERRGRMSLVRKNWKR